MKVNDDGKIKPSNIIRSYVYNVKRSRATNTTPSTLAAFKGGRLDSGVTSEIDRILCLGGGLFLFVLDKRYDDVQNQR